MRQCQVNFSALPRPFEPIQIYLITFSIKIFEIFTKILSRLRRFDGNSHLGGTQIFDSSKLHFLPENHIFFKVRTFCVNELGCYSIFRVKRLRVGKSQVQQSSNISHVHEHETCLSQLLQLQLEIVSFRALGLCTIF